MGKINVALIGLGTVGKGVYETIHTHQNRLQKITGKEVAVSTIVVEHVEKHTNDEVFITNNINEIIEDKNIDLVFEAINGKEPAFSYLKECIKAGKHVITANKEMFATHGRELKHLAQECHVKIGFDATTAGGIPVIQTIQQLLQTNRIQKIQGILNGTSNYILTEMREKKLPFSDALQQAQELGYAEADPTNDVEGFDAFYKLMILSELTFHQQPALESVKRAGITSITQEDIDGLQDEKIKHIATVYREGEQLVATIEPTVINADHPLYAIEGVDNAVHIEADIIGELTLVGPGAGSLPTASSMIEDFCTIMKQTTDREVNTEQYIS